VFRILKKTARPVVVGEKTSSADYSGMVVVGKQGLIIKPGEVVLGVTKEKISLSSGLCARIDGRTRFARLGLLVHLSSSLVQPGVNNVQVLEIMNASPNELVLKPGLKICQLVFEELKGTAVYGGAFRYQTKP